MLGCIRSQRDGRSGAQAEPLDMEARHGRGSQGGTCWGALLAQSDGAGCTPNFKTGIGAYLIGVSKGVETGPTTLTYA